MKFSQNKNFAFEAFNHSSISKYLSPREGEKKLGESIENNSASPFVILGICEDSGPRANLGNAGSTNAFDAFLGKFLNMQSNQFLNGNEISIAGKIVQQTSPNDIEILRSHIVELDEFVQEIIHHVVSSNQILIVIGGGHNNAYPIIKSMQSIHKTQHSILNIDPHADCRPLEGRHSGNPFSYAISEGAISKYGVLGLHEQYNSQGILDFLKAHKCTHSYFDNYLDGTKSLRDDVESFINESSNTPLGIEIDLDCIENMPTSAFTPSGFSVNEIRSVIKALNAQTIHYLHLPEGSPNNHLEESIVGKTLAYFVTDFMKKQ
ncbi:MAG: formimidoylglutamase [Crocinitomicaceae bacterium]|nr:formimidoylglutamase [Crocinitomicaceae bacterium]